MVQQWDNTSLQPGNRVQTPAFNLKFGVDAVKARKCAAIVAAAAALSVAGFAGIQASRGHSAAPASGLADVTVPMRVTPGASLWSLARRYGNPQVNIVERVEQMAILNNMTTSDTLMPGQRLLVKVENPVEVAHLKQNVAVITVPRHTAH